MSAELVVWDEAFSVGFPAIDEQHKKLVDMINELFQLSENGSNEAKSAFAKAFSKAGEYAQTHFHDEEECLKKTDYPSLDEHKKEHVSFMTEVWNEFSLFNKGNESPAGLAEFLKKWLLNHIAVTDKQYAPYLAK